MDVSESQSEDQLVDVTVEGDLPPRLRCAELFSQFTLELTRVDGLPAVCYVIREFCEKLFDWDALVFSVRRGRGSQHFRSEMLIDTVDGERIECPRGDYSLPEYSETWATLLEGKSVLINRSAEDPGNATFVFGPKQRRSASLMFVPICSGDRVSGIISLQSYKPNHFDDDDLAVLLAIADAVGPTLLRCRAEERMQDFLNLGERLNQVTDTTGVARVVYNAAADLVGWDYISIHLYEQVTGRLHLVLGLRRSHDICQVFPSIEHNETPAERGVIADVLKGRSINLSTESISPEDLPRFYPFGQSLPLLTSVMMSPIRSMNRVVGVLCLQSDSGAAYGSDESDIARALADYCSGALERAWAQQNLQQSEEGYRLLVENVNDGIVITQDDRFVFFNDRFADMLGYTPEELKSKSHNDVYSSTGLEIIKQRGEFREAGIQVPDRYETAFVKKTGDELPVEANVRLIPNYNGKKATFAVIRDISQRKSAEQRLRRSEQELRALFNAMTDIILVLNSDGKYVSGGPIGHDWSGTPWYMETGESVYDVFSHEKAEYLLLLIRRSLNTRQTINVEYDLEDSNGETGWYNATISPMSENTVLVVARDVTERRMAEEELFRSNARYEALLDGSEDYIFVLDREMRFVHANSIVHKRLGVRSEDLIGKTLDEVNPEASLTRFIDLVQSVFETGQPVTYDEDVIVNGGLLCTETVISPVFSRMGEVEAVLGISRDVTSRRQSALALKRSEERYATAVRAANDGIWDWNLETNGIYLSPRWWAIMGEENRDEDAECDPSLWFERVHPNDLEALKNAIACHIAGETNYLSQEHRVMHLSGEWRWVLCRGLCVHNDSGEPMRMAGSLSDITDRKIAEARLQYGATHDALTNLPNRAYFLDCLRQTMNLARKRQSPGGSFAVLFLDLDRFKVVNDSLGHLAGDELIITTARRLESCVRPGDTVARMGGDEFTVLLDHIGDDRDVTHVAKRIIKELASPVEVKGFQVQTTVSMGIAFDKEEYHKPEDLLRDADTAMYRAKATGRNRYQVFDKKMHASMMSQLKLEAELRQAVARQEFVMHYQPIIRIVDKRIVGFEALIRWNHPERGHTGPGTFISLAEETGLIIPIGWWVIDQALEALTVWNSNRPRGEALSVNINLSPRQFMQPNLVEHVMFLINHWGVSPRNVVIEITESILMDDAIHVVEDIQRLREAGIRMVLDDFGTGYSSLSFLQRFPLDMVKIDQTFIRSLDTHGPSREIVSAMLTLARGLGLTVTAEGVETQQQYEALEEMNCDFGQGYYYYQPLTLESSLEVISQGDISVAADR